MVYTIVIYLFLLFIGLFGVCLHNGETAKNGNTVITGTLFIALLNLPLIGKVFGWW